MTLAIEAVGVAIFCVWVVIPIGEFRSIRERLRATRGAAPAASAGTRPERRE